jgi:hypothetical protein
MQQKKKKKKKKKTRTRPNQKPKKKHLPPTKTDEIKTQKTPQSAPGPGAALVLLIDSVCKRAGPPFPPLFAPHLATTVSGAFSRAGPQDRAVLRRCVGTWRSAGVFEADRVALCERAIDACVAREKKAEVDRANTALRDLFFFGFLLFLIAGFGCELDLIRELVCLFFWSLDPNVVVALLLLLHWLVGWMCILFFLYIAAAPRPWLRSCIIISSSNNTIISSSSSTTSIRLSSIITTSRRRQRIRPEATASIRRRSITNLRMHIRRTRRRSSSRASGNERSRLHPSSKRCWFMLFLSVCFCSVSFQSINQSILTQHSPDTRPKPTAEMPAPRPRLRSICSGRPRGTLRRCWPSARRIRWHAAASISRPSLRPLRTRRPKTLPRSANS